MSRPAYRLTTIKDEENYLEAGYTPEETKKIIEIAYDDDEDFISKKNYITYAKKRAEYYSKKLGFDIDWETLYGRPFESDYRYCARCGNFFFETDGCECDYMWG